MAQRAGLLSYLWKQFQESYDPETNTAQLSPPSLVFSVGLLVFGLALPAYVPFIAPAAQFHQPEISLVLTLLGGGTSLIARVKRCRGPRGTPAILLDNAFYVGALSWAAANMRSDFGLFYAVALGVMLLFFQAPLYRASILLALVIAVPTLVPIVVARPDPIVVLGLIASSGLGFARTFQTRRDGEHRFAGLSPFELAGRYRIGAMLGYGGMGSVYQGMSNDGRLVAIKLLHPHLFGRPEQRNPLEKEIQIANQLKHTGVVEILDWGEAHYGTPFMVMELLEGKTLRTRVGDDGGSLPWREATELAVRVLEVLEVAHERGTVHCDVKPSNIFLCDDGRIKLLDFGIARTSRQLLEETLSVSVAGTPTCIAPEQVLDPGSIDGRADLWSLAATLFWAISGQWPRELPQPLASLAEVAQAVPRKLDAVSPGLPKDLVRAVDIALEVERDNRWPTATVMKQQLLSVLNANVETALPSRVGQPEVGTA